MSEGRSKSAPLQAAHVKTKRGTAAKRGEEQAQRLGFAVVVEIRVLHEQVAEHREKVAVGRAVGRAIKNPAAGVDGRERATFAADEGVARETLREHPVETHERALGLVA